MPQGIRINSIVPGPIADTEGLKRLAPTDETMAAMAQRVPLKRLGRIEDIAAWRWCWPATGAPTSPAR